MDLRNYGLGNYTQYVIGRPRLAATLAEIENTKAECPNCKIQVLCDIEIVMEGMPLMKEKYALGKYLSCPACPWASPMMCVGIPVLPNWWKAL
jgi:hypothetical protein